MRQEEKAKAYDEALLEWMRKVYPTLTGADKEDVEHYFPELKESEDERIREGLIRHLEELRDWKVDTMSPIKVSSHYDAWIAYLEKQKERGPLTKEEERILQDIILHLEDEGCPTKWKGLLHDIYNLPYEKQEEQKQSINIDQLKSLMLQYLQEAANEKNDADIEADTDKWARKILGYNFEKKPVEPSDDELRRHQDELYNFKMFATKQAKEHHISCVHDFEWDNFCTELLSYFAEQKPVEWSEDFEENIRNLLHDKLTGHSKDGTMTWTTFIDDKTLRDIVNGIRFYVGKEALKYPNKELNVTEWSEDDEEMYDEALTGVLLAKNRMSDTGCIGLAKRFEKAYKWLKSLRPQPHWKPSEEQMEALERASTNEYLSAKQFDILVSLYEQLKKLM